MAMLTVAESPTFEHRARQSGARPGHWLSIVSHLDPKYGGLSAAVPALATAVVESGQNAVTIAGFCAEGEHFVPPALRGVNVAYYPLSRSEWLRRQAAREAFQRQVANADGLHIHGLWQSSTSTAARLARRERKPFLISAHGMLEPWALANKKWKKRLYAALFERKNLQQAACLHALTNAEARDYRRFGLTNPIAVIPNGVTVPSSASRELFLDRFPQLRSERLILFLGRIHFKKGLDILAEGFAAVARETSDAHLVIAGPDFEGTQSRILEQLAGLGITSRVTFTGMLSGPEKWSALAAAEAFILPSYSEGLSVSVLEAMGMGLPVIVTEQCNLPEVKSHECGWVIDPRAAEVTRALRELLQATTRDRETMGENGKRLVAARYAWPVIGEQMSAVYGWLTGGPRPASVQLPEKVAGQ